MQHRSFKLTVQVGATPLHVSGDLPEGDLYDAIGAALEGAHKALRGQAARLEVAQAIAARMEEFAGVALPAVSVNRSGQVTAVPPRMDPGSDKTMTIVVKGDRAGAWYDFATRQAGDAMDLAEWAFGAEAADRVAAFLESEAGAAQPIKGLTGGLNVEPPADDA